MDKQKLEQIANQLIADGKGILAADESNGTMGKRLKSIGVENSEANRIGYRATLFTAPGCEQFISGVILYDETIRQKVDGVPVPEFLAKKGIIPGIKVDTGAMPLAGHEGETITEGLDGLRARLAEYHAMGARFAKWRAVIRIGPNMPSEACLHTNAHALARYAALCQEAGIVPIIEPEVLMDGGHTIAQCEAVTETIHHKVFAELRAQGVHLGGILLKPNMVISGTENGKRAGTQEVAEKTVKLLRRTVPAAVPGIVFLSGGQGDEEATEHLDLMNKLGANPWKLSFSYGRALQAPALSTWGGKAENRTKAQNVFLHRAKLNMLAAKGEYAPKMEKELVQ